MKYQLTDAGIRLLAKINTGIKLQLTKALCGSAYSEAPENLESMQEVQQTIQIDETEIENEAVKITCILSNLELEQEYALRQIGIYARDPDTEDEILFIIGQQDPGDRIPGIHEVQVEYKYIIGIKASNVSEVSMDISGNDFLRKVIFLDHLSDSNAHGFRTEVDRLDGRIDTSDKLINDLYEELYDTATVNDIDNIIAGTYSESDESGLIDVADASDIEEIIQGTYVDNDDDITQEDKEYEAVDNIVDKLFT